MRLLNKIFTRLILTTIITICPIISLSASEGKQFWKKNQTKTETSEVEKYSLLAIKYAGKTPYIDRMRACIDTAELICHKENMWSMSWAQQNNIDPFISNFKL